MEPEQQERFREAVDRKNEQAEEQSRAQGAGGSAGAEAPGAIQGDEPSLRETGRTQDVFSVRDKNSGKGKKTADKWNQ